MAKIFSTHRRMIISLPESSRARPSDSPKGRTGPPHAPLSKPFGAWTNNEQNSKQIKPHIIRAFVAKYKHMKSNQIK